MWSSGNLRCLGTSRVATGISGGSAQLQDPWRGSRDAGGGCGPAGEAASTRTRTCSGVDGRPAAPSLDARPRFRSHGGGAAVCLSPHVAKCEAKGGGWKRRLLPREPDVTAAGHPGCEGCPDQQVLFQEECSRERPRGWLSPGPQEGPDVDCVTERSKHGSHGSPSAVSAPAAEEVG